MASPESDVIEANLGAGITDNALMAVVRPTVSTAERRQAARYRRLLQLMASIVVMFLIVIGYLWSQEPAATIAAQDFNHDYAGATLVHQGRAAHLYSIGAQQDVFRAATGSVPADYKTFSMLPTGALLLSPLAALPYQTAFRVYVGINIALLVLAVVLVLRRFRPPAEVAALASLTAVGSGGFAYMMLWGQWDALTAVLLALGWDDLRRGDRFRAGVWLGLAVGIGKPQLLIGVAVLVLASGRRRVIAGALAAGAVLGIVDVVLVGTGGVGQFLQVGGQYNPLYGLVQMMGIGSLTATLFGQTGLAAAVGGVVGLVTLGVCAWLGRRFATHPEAVDGLLAAAVALSLYGSPHAFDYNLVLLGPPMVWMVAGRWRQARDAARAWPDNTTMLLLSCWWGLGALSFAEQVIFSPHLAFRLSPFLLLALAGLCIRCALEQPRPMPASSWSRRALEPRGSS